MTVATTAKRSKALQHRSPGRAGPVLSLAFILALGSFGLLPQVRDNPALMRAFAGATGLLMAAWGLVWTRRPSQAANVRVVLRPQHYLQAIAHASIFVYWGLYWDPILDAVPLIAGQIVFAYALDTLLVWWRRDTYMLGFGPFPIVFSTNLFLRFRDDWFYLQFVMIGVGFLAKEFIRWNKDGRRVHIFNPSSFPLALASLLLILTGTSHLTWGEEIATTLFQPPHIFLFIFLVALPGQYLFGVTTMTLSAVLTTYAFGLAYFAVTGTYFFIDNYIPIAVFLGMHLLFTDPSTSPRSELGRIIYGAIYGVSVVALYWLLARIGAPTFYDKLLQVPLMNLLVRFIDRNAQTRLAWLDPARLGRRLTPMRRNLLYTSLWVLVFAGMTAAHGVGDYHPGHDVRFWEQACREGRRAGCTILGRIETRYCSLGAGWACNEVGILMAEGRLEDNSQSMDAFARACGLGFAAGCQNRQLPPAETRARHDDPRLSDFVLILREGKGPLPDQSPADTFARGCRKGWVAGCGELGGLYLMGNGVPQDRLRASALLQEACDGGHPASCTNLALMYDLGDGIARDQARSRALLRKACDLGLTDACRWLADRGK